MEFNQKKEVPVEGLLPVIRSRWSPRTFAATAVEKEKLNLILEAGRWAPSCYNEQPWRFVVGEKNGVGNYDGILSNLVEFNQAWAKSAPVLIVILSNGIWNPQHPYLPNKPNAWAPYDCGQAAGFMLLQAQSLGLYTHQMGGFNGEGLKKTFEVPEGFEVHSVLALGYEGSANDVPDMFKDKEGAERTRRPLSESVFVGKWGNGYN